MPRIPHHAHSSTPPRLRRATALVIALIVGAGLMPGCGAKGTNARASEHRAPSTAAAHAPTTPAPAPSGQITNTDACASRLHDICGALLLHYARTNDLPQALSDLQGLPGVEGPASLVCPVSKTPYLYNPGGVFLPERNTYLVLYDPQPSHQGHRWAITVAHPRPGVPLVTKVIALPESFFALRPPR